MNIVAIGGGEIRSKETFAIDKFIRELSGKHEPKVLFIPTASGDFEGYCDVFDETYTKDLGCRVSTLKLISSNPNKAEIEDSVRNADIIYVGGGDTKAMLENWHSSGVDRLLKQAYESGTILTGLSAGAVCCYEYAHSDYESFLNQDNWSYRLLDCLGFIKGVFCPHLDAEHREQDFIEKLTRNNLSGIGCENNAAVWYSQGSAPKVVTSEASANASSFIMVDGVLRKHRYFHGDSLLVW